MKTIVNKLPVMILAAFTLWACQEQKLDYKNGSLDGVSQLIAPAGDGTTYLSNTTDVLNFKWKTVNSGAVKYEVSFSSSATGAEIYRFVPTDGALTGTTGISLALLDQIASMAGILTGSEGDIYWTVYSKKGTAEVKATAASKKLPVKRFTGFAEAPVHLYITGGATEGGTDITKAQQFRNDEENVFKVVTSLKAGQPFFFTNNNAGTGYSEYSFYPDKKIYVEDGDPMTVEADGIYRITANIARNRYTIELLENLSLYYPAGMDVNGDGVLKYSFPMEYQGGGIWKLADFKFAFTDNRYQFRLDVAGKERIWGSKDSDANPPTVIGGSYYYIFENAVAADGYSYSYKLMSSLIGLTTDIYVDMSASATQPTHRFDLSSEYDLQPVASLTTPADNATIDLNTTYTMDFSWAEPTYDKASFPAKYEVVFFSDAAGTTEIGKAASDDYGLDTSVTIGRTILDNAAKGAGIDIGAAGVIYWSVRTIMMNESVIATAAPRKINITRIELPAQLYISGTNFDGTTVAVGSAYKMRKLEDGVFQGYYNFRTTTAYRLTDGTSGSYITYEMSNNQLVPGASTATFATTGWGSINSSDRVYRITVNFKTNTITAQITRYVYFYQCSQGTNGALTYGGNGVWTNTRALTGTSSSNNDNRYLFRVGYTSAPTSNTNWSETWGSANWNNDSAPNDSWLTSRPEFWYITVWVPANYKVIDSGHSAYDQWGYSFKFSSDQYPKAAARNVTIRLDMNATNPTHTITWN